MANPEASTEAHSTTRPAAGESRRPVVLQVVPALGSGGAERGCIDVAAAIVAAGGTALVVSSGGPLVRELERVGARHFVEPVDSKNPWTVLGRNTRRLALLVRRHGVDILHARSRAPAWSALRAARRTGCAFVTTFHGTYNESGPIKRKYNSVMARGERVIAISEHIADLVAERYGVGEDRLRVIHRGVDLDRFDPALVTAPRVIALATRWRLPDGLPVVMLPGRLTRWKGQTVLIEALTRLGHRNFCALLVGDDQGRDDYRRELEALVRRHGLAGEVRIAGHCNDMPAAYMLADVVVSASTDAEAFGRIVAEAQAMGRPVIATDHGGARETVVEGETGWLVPPGDPEALARALGEALALDAETRDRMSRRAIAHVRARFSKEEMCARTLAVYDEILAARAGAEAP